MITGFVKSLTAKDNASNVGVYEYFLVIELVTGNLWVLILNLSPTSVSVLVTEPGMCSHFANENKHYEHLE